jgi:hypothetical protein
MQRQQALSTRTAPAFGSHWVWSLWWRWVLANLVGEFIGLGVAGGLGAGVTLVLDNVTGTGTFIVLTIALVMAATVEGAIVGLAQWWVLGHYLPTLTRRVWLLATVLGAIVAWMTGMMLSTLGADFISARESTAALLFGATLGPVVGALLGAAQWLALRHYVQRAGWWVLANALAWTAGMAVIFAATGIVQESTPVAVVAITWAVSGILAGMVVAAIHGLALVWLLRANAPAG